ncbi:hypothetical protein H5410_019442 [Solanum commersonii]|uniref:Uncharacterized protein n=1 Tax=Solanum commersonii TaxID=4109 RepID=A0A9J5Z5L8_SOLCO|nr:hypothetical protein H5410_019442 [Solanum commersonii]
MCQIREPAKFRGDMRTVEVIRRKVEPSEMRELEKAAIGVNGPNKFVAAEVKLNDMTSHLIAYDSIP